MSFKITITETRNVTRKVGNEWKVIGQKEVARETSIYDPGDKDDPKTRITDEYGYTPVIEKTVAEEREVLKQEVDALDLSAVIKAINGL